MRRPSLQAVFLWLEAIALGSLALTKGPLWLLPATGLLALHAALLSRGLLLAVPWALAATAWWFFKGSPPEAIPVTVPVLALVLGVIHAFCGILTGLGTGETKSPLKLFLGRFVVGLHFLAAGAFLAATYLQQPAQLWFAHGAAALSLVLCGDTLLKLLGRLYTPKRHWHELPAPGAFFFFRWLGPEGRACFPAARTVDELSLKLAEMWMWPVVRKSLPALAVVSLLLTWAMTSLHQVPVGHLGVRQQCGTWQTVNLQPGLHASLPWPFGGVQHVDTSSVRETVLGFRADPGQPILWERAHYEDEQMSLVGGGDDLLSISVPVFYRIDDPAAYLRSSNDSGQLLRSLADRILLHLSLNRPAADLMTGARETLRAEFLDQLQRELDAQHSGLHIESVYFRDIHPPVAVAPTFQEVVGAIEEKEAFLHEGEEYRRDVVTRAKGDATQVVVNATSAADNRLARVHGETSRFLDQHAAWKESPFLYELREGFVVFDRTLGGAKKAIFDEKLRGSIPTHLDLRRVLNPDLVNSGPPAPQSLVPRPIKSRDAFDLDIEGYLRSDRGEIPAANLAPENRDNLLTPAP